MKQPIKIHPRDNVLVALSELSSGEFGAIETIPAGHKIADCDIPNGGKIIKYGCVIGTAVSDIKKGSWVHTHNVKTNLNDNVTYTYNHESYNLPEIGQKTFSGFRRPNGKVGVRNELWIIPTVGCVNGVCENLVHNNQELVKGSIDGLYCYTHPFGCSQLGKDHAQTRKLLASLAQHPNAGGVLVVGLGCENLTMEQFVAELGDYDKSRIRFMICQQEEDELEKGALLLNELAEYASTFSRECIPASELIIGMKCGGSDGFSGITANPVVGRFSDMLISLGGSTILTEVPEMFGAENILFSRCKNVETFDMAVNMVNRFKDYFISHGQVVYENPSPGNKAGGITTLEDKSCGCVQKGGSAQVTDVLEYAEPVTSKGLNILSGPGNDLVSSTALAASGAHIILFTTGRGTPFGSPIPTVKISSNSNLYARKKRWIDFDAGIVADGASIEHVGEQLLYYVLNVASGELTSNEIHGYREISIFKDGVVL